MTPEQIDLARLSSAAVGGRHLKKFLEYAQQGPSAIADVGPPPAQGLTSPFEAEVATVVCQLGWNVRLRVGRSDFLVDVAVVDPRNADRCVLGILCDGPTYGRLKTARDRDRLRHAVLESRGWKLHHMWSTGWLLHRDREIDRLSQRLTSLRSYESAWMAT